MSVSDSCGEAPLYRRIKEHKICWPMFHTSAHVHCALSGPHAMQEKSLCCRSESCRSRSESCHSCNYPESSFARFGVPYGQKYHNYVWISLVVSHMYITSVQLVQYTNACAECV